MAGHPRRLFTLAVCLCLALAGCGPNNRADPDPESSSDPVRNEIMAYLQQVRPFFNHRQFDELERRADEARASKEKFGNGSWKIRQFYNSLECRPDEPESMWELHQKIHEDWIAAKPESITARVALIEFLTSYAWHARGSGYANTVSLEGGRLFDKRLRLAHQVLTDSREMAAKCPVWWLAGQKIALGEGWPKDVYEKFVAQAEAFEPTFWGYEVSRSNFLATKWYGSPGEWEAAADRAAADPNGLGLEIYARCAIEQVTNYTKFFGECRADWSKAKAGCELMEQRYPNSREVASAFCRLACVAGDRATAKRLFARLKEDDYTGMWITRDYYWHTARDWANGAP